MNEDSEYILVINNDSDTRRKIDLLRNVFDDCRDISDNAIGFWSEGNIETVYSDIRKVLGREEFFFVGGLLSPSMNGNPSLR